jgi:uncharacterized membrane protein
VDERRETSSQSATGISPTHAPRTEQTSVKRARSAAPGERSVRDEPLHFALARFERPDSADAMFATACERSAGRPWLRKVAVVECHNDGHLVLRGTVAGHYIDVDESDRVSEPGAQRGSVIGGLLGTLLGPPGLAVGLLLGTAAGSRTGTPTDVEPEPKSVADQLRDALSPGTSALLMVAERSAVTEMLEAIGPQAAAVKEGTLTVDAQAALAADLDQAVPAHERT